MAALQRPPRAPWHPPRPQVRAFPVFPALAAVVVLLACLEVYSWLGQGKAGPLQVLARSFSSAPAWVPHAPSFLAREKAVFNNGQEVSGIQPDGPILRLTLPVRPQDIQMGDPNGRVNVMILTDPVCGTCRSAMRDWLAAANRKDVFVLVKFWPEDPKRLTGGLAFAMARKGGVVPQFWAKLREEKGDISDTRILEILDASGLSFDKQREMLINQPDFTASMDTDIARMRQLRIPNPPLVAVDGTVVDPAALGDAIDERLKGNPLPGDEWMMRR